MSSYALLRRRYGALLYACGMIAGLVTFLMMLLVVANALLRFGINMPIAGTLEITESMLTTLIFLSLALTQYEGGHIHVVLVTKQLPVSLQRFTRLIAMGLGLMFFAWCTYAAWGFALKSWMIDEHEWGSIQYPLYPVKFVVFIGLLLLTIQFFLDMISALLGTDGRDEPMVTSEEEML